MQQYRKKSTCNSSDTGNQFNEGYSAGNRDGLFIAHDLSMVKYISDRIGVLHLGHLVEGTHYVKCTDEEFEKWK